MWNLTPFEIVFVLCTSILDVCDFMKDYWKSACFGAILQILLNDCIAIA